MDKGLIWLNNNQTINQTNQLTTKPSNQITHSQLKKLYFNLKETQKIS